MERLQRLSEDFSRGDVELKEIMARDTARFADRKADWAAFEDAKQA